MKSPNPSTQKTSASCLGALALGAGLLASTSDHAFARFIYDMRAISVDDPLASVLGPKSVVMVPNAVVTFEIWVQITSPSGAGVFGYQNSVFSILSSDGRGILGNVGLFNPIAPWNVSSSQGTITASLDRDSDFDNGTNRTNSIAGMPKARSDNQPAGGGDPAFNYAQTTAVHVPSVHFQPVTVGGAESGYEFEIGTVTFTMTACGLTDPFLPTGINVRPATNLNAGAVRASSASFVEGGVPKNGLTGFFGVGSDVLLFVGPAVEPPPCTPEPSTFHMVLLGAAGLAGMGRGRMRRG